jgi:5-methylcytosine-specific restriction endonuclease McrA
MKIDKADALFSKYIRIRDNWTCQRCHTRHEEGSRGLHCSHFFGRANENTRFDPQNCTAICFGCHKYFDEKDREAYREFKIKQIGKKEFEKLTIRARMSCKKDRKLSYLYVQQLFKELEEERGENFYPDGVVKI